MGLYDLTASLEGADLVEERRVYPRFRVSLRGVCSIAGGSDRPCIVLDLSLGGAEVACTGPVTIDATTSLLLPHLGLLSARIARTTEGGFGVAFVGGAAQRRRIQDYLVYVLRLADDQADEDRGFERIVPLRRTVEVRRADARAHMARIRDISRSGVAFTTTVAMTSGEPIYVGGTPAEVIRLFDGGAAARFPIPLPPTFDATVTL